MIKHQAFLDLEESLAARLRQSWSRYWSALSADILHLTAQGKFDEAHKLADTLDLAPLFDKARPYARTIGMSALLLGASRLTPSIRSSRIANAPPKQKLDGYLSQLQTMLARNATEALRLMVHEWITAEEQKLVKFDPSQPRAPKGTPEGGQWVDLKVVESPDKKSVKIVVPSESVRLKDHAVIEANWWSDGLQINWSEVAEKWQGSGLGVRIYAKLADYAHSKGMALLSDSVVSVAAQRMYTALERRGYKVEKNPRAIDRYSDGALVVRGPEKNKWVYRVTNPHLTKGDYPGHPFRGNQYVDAGGFRQPFRREGRLTTSKGEEYEYRWRHSYEPTTPEEHGFTSGEVEVLLEGTRIARLTYNTWGDDRVQIGDVAVEPMFQRRGIARAMFNLVRSSGLPLQHNLEFLSPEGEAFAAATQVKEERVDFSKAEWRKADADRNQVKIMVAGKQYFALAASVQVSRLSAFGFLAEAVDKGVKNYRVDAVLDEKTCEVCRHMDGWVFPVEAGFALATQIMETDDPDALKSITPFYAQNKASLAALATYGTVDFIEEGMSLPPYHPLCRCILTPTEETADVHPTDRSDRVALASQALYGEGDGVRLTQNLFGVERLPEEADTVAAPASEEDSRLLEMLGRLVTGEQVPATEQGWAKQVLSQLLEQPQVQSDALVMPTPFEGTTIPSKWAAPFDPKRLASLASSRWPWLAGILGWLALREPKQESAFTVDEDADDENEEMP